GSLRAPPPLPPGRPRSAPWTAGHPRRPPRSSHGPGRRPGRRTGRRGGPRPAPATAAGWSPSPPGACPEAWSPSELHLLPPAALGLLAGVLAPIDDVRPGQVSHGGGEHVHQTGEWPDPEQGDRAEHVQLEEDRCLT